MTGKEAKKLALAGKKVRRVDFAPTAYIRHAGQFFECWIDHPWVGPHEGPGHESRVAMLPGRFEQGPDEWELYEWREPGGDPYNPFIPPGGMPSRAK
jgi:hypothetical protein